MKKYFVFVCLFITVKSFAQRVDSLDFKIGQMLMVGYASTEIKEDNATIKDIEAGKVGGILLFEKNINPKDSYVKLKQLTWTLQQHAPVPLFVAIDQEGGKVNRLKEKYGFPKSVSADYLGKVASLDSTQFYAEMTASTLAGLGFNVNFAPVVDLSINKSNPIIARADRAYSDNPDSVALHAAKVIDAHRKFNIVTVLKHFPGHGSSHSDTHLGIADVTDYWQSKEVTPYDSLLRNGEIDAIMTAHIVNKKLEPQGLPGTLSKKIVTGLLRDSLHYNGVVFSDDMQMHAITKHYGLEKSVKLSIQAGVDVLIFSNNIQGSENRTVDTVHDIIKKLIKNGDLTEERINESYQRIMKLKRSRIETE
ncbi:glycoside hydrolase family 3 protein [Fulvivirga sediminis]|uniref:beta-N-acetylhexosaminidase n=1 Tax=Fulvivirga sediminis TaxID=2803949 RepID=A0A937FBM0_9BACT|nr:glycoside hydrolase family 3 N-terminal domain-containing protein [Fulvivirga sediminis]MBL3657829.1 glycoside hydrolase family 3 protein [Fulvivirga sediminis]